MDLSNVLQNRTKEEKTALYDKACRELTKWQMYDPKALIAGGFPRDLHFDREIKDVDIWVRIPESFSLSDFQHVASNIIGRELEFNFDNDEFDVGYDLGFDNIKFISSEYEKDGLIFNIIGLKTPHTPYNTIYKIFDFDLCLFFISTPESGIIQSESLIDNTSYLMLDHKSTQGRRAIDVHLPRLKDKYPEFTFKISRKFLLEDIL